MSYNRLRNFSIPDGRTLGVLGRLYCARILGYLIYHIRMLDDRPLEEIAPLAGMTVDGWLAIEAGATPGTREQVQLMGDAIHCHPLHSLQLDRLYDGAK